MLLSPSSKSRTLYRAANSGLPPPKGGAGGGGRELWFQTRPYSHRAKNLGLDDHLGLVPPMIQLEKSRVNFGASKKSRTGQKNTRQWSHKPKGTGQPRYFVRTPEGRRRV